MDQFRSRRPASRLQPALARLTALAPLLAGIGLVLLGLVLFAHLAVCSALLGWVMIVAGAALLGPANSAVGPALDLSQPVAISADTAVFAFAEALADPCLVLDRRGVAL